MSRRTSLVGASALAITVALSLGTGGAMAQAVGYTWSSGDYTNGGGTISGTATGLRAIGPASGTLTNTGVISGSNEGVYNEGNFDALVNSGTISGDFYGVVTDWGGSIGTLTNSGTISGSVYGVNGSYGSIGTLINQSGGTIRGGATAVTLNGVGGLTNDGVISADGSAVANGGSIGTVTNSGTISGDKAVYNVGEIGTLTNSGTISGNPYGVSNEGGNIGTLTNSGAISGGSYGVSNEGGSIGTLTNSGIISASQGDAVAIFSRGGSIGTLINESGGTILSNQAAMMLNSTIDALTNDGVISANGAAIVNGGTIGTLTNSGTLSGYYGIYNEGSIGRLDNSGSIGGGVDNRGTMGAIANSGVIAGALTNSGTISGGDIGVLNDHGSIGTLTNRGTISGNYTGVRNDGGTISALLNEGTILAGTEEDGGRGLLVTSSGTITNGIVNTGTISSVGHGIEVDNGTVGADASGNAIDNSGLIKGVTGFSDSSGIRLSDAVINGNIVNQSTGTLWGSGYGLYVNGGSTITGNVTNSGTIYGGSEGISNSGSIGTLTNSGTISAGSSGGGINNDGVIGTLTNSGTIATDGAAVANGGSITTLTNSGTLHGYDGVHNSGSIGALDNSGTISGYGNGIYNDRATIGTLTNSGTISGSQYAIYNDGTIGPIVNSGVIAGNIANTSADTLSISGGSDGTFGTLTGYNGGIGTISNTASNLVFSSGNLLLNDNINASGHTVSNTGATLRLDNTISITGNYSQSGGGLISTATGNGASYGHLVVDGNASVSNSTITVSGSGLTAGQTFIIVDATGSNTGSYSGNTGYVAVTNGLTATVSTVGNDLVVTLVGGAAGNSNTWTAKGADTGGIAAPVGVVLDNIRTDTSPTAVAFQNNVLTALDALPTTSQGAAIKQLAPSQGAPTQMSTAASNAVLGAVEQHQQTAMAYESETGVAAGSETHDSAIWGQVLGGGARRGSNAEADGYRLMDFGLATGIDHRFTPNVLGGVAVSWLRAWTQGSDNSSGSSSTLDSYQLTLYGTYRQERAFVDGQLGFGWNEFDQQRGIAFLGSTASAKYSGQQYLAKATVGYDVPAGGVTVTPMASLRWLRSVTDAYEESGAGAANLSVDSQGVNSVTQDLGAKVAWSVPTSLGALKPEVKLAWVHDYTQGAIATSGLMAGSAFAVTTPRTQPDGVRIGLGTTLSGDDDLSFRLEYEGELRAQYQSHTALVKALWGF